MHKTKCLAVGLVGKERKVVKRIFGGMRLAEWWVDVDLRKCVF
jgi:hypothetical protein